MRYQTIALKRTNVNNSEVKIIRVDGRHGPNGLWGDLKA